MKLENQVCSLELSKRLKELGVKQDSLVYWMKILHLIKNEQLENGDMKVTIEEYRIELGSPLAWNVPKEDRWSAFTVAELGKMLPFSIRINGKSYFYATGKPSPANEYLPAHEVNYSSGDECHWLAREELESNARAKMLIYLLENKLMELPNET